MNFPLETIYFLAISVVLSVLCIISAYKETAPSSADAARRDDITMGVAFLILVPLFAHLLFSWRGFNPSDDGFILAYSRRILEGQVPHRDFITIRPAGSAYLHAPFVFFGGDYTFWISRAFVWFQFACIAWAWTSIINKMTNAHLKPIEKVIFALIAFAFSSHNFPPMAWHTIDGLFLFSIGLTLCLKSSERTKLAGYFIIGLAYLCKQNFLPLALTVVILGDWRRIRYWLAMIVPGLIYLAYLFFAGAMPDAIVQLCSQSKYSCRWSN